MDGSYTFKDILFGLYNEYVILQEQLDSLNKYILLEENNLEKVKFHLIEQFAYDRVRMLCTLYDRKSKLEKIVEKMEIYLGIYPNYRVSYVNEIIDKYSEIIDGTRKQEFKQSVFHIFNTDFARNIRLIHNGVGYDHNPFLSVTSSGMFVGLWDLGNLDFNSSKDKFLHAYSSKGRLTNDKVDYMLNMEFSKKNFPEYYQKLIEDSNFYGKNVDIVGEFGYSRNGKFEIVPESKRLVLVKK